MIAIDQSPIGRTPRCNPATYIKVFDEIRKSLHAAARREAARLQAGAIQLQRAGGRCEACEGNGSNKLEMDFLADIWVTCPVCEGHRFNRETLQVRLQGKVDRRRAGNGRARSARPCSRTSRRSPISCKRCTMSALDYLKLGQPSPTLSGGEAQRIKLARELVEEEHRANALPARRTDHRTALCRHRDAAEGAARLRRCRQYRAGGRTQSGRHQDRRLGHRPGPRRRCRRAVESWPRGLRKRSPPAGNRTRGTALSDGPRSESASTGNAAGRPRRAGRDDNGPRQSATQYPGPRRRSSTI